MDSNTTGRSLPMEHSRELDDVSEDELLEQQHELQKQIEVLERVRKQQKEEEDENDFAEREIEEGNLDSPEVDEDGDLSFEQEFLDEYDDIPIGDRLYLKGQEMVRRRTEKAMEAESQRMQREALEQQPRPKISEGSTVVKRSGGDPVKFYKLQTDWLHRRNRVLESKREKEEVEWKQLNREQKASAKSNRILAGRHKGPIGDWQEREQHFRAVHSERPVPGTTFKPTISPAAQHLRRKGTVGDRLYDAAKQKRIEDQQAQKDRTEGDRKVTKEEVDALLRKMELQDKTAKRKVAVKRAELEREEGSFQPEVNPRSKEILRRQGGHVPIHLRSGSILQQHNKFLEQQHQSHQQQLQKGEEAHEQHPKKPVSAVKPAFWSKVQLSQQRHEAKIRSLQTEQREELEKECTFRPATNKKSRLLANKAGRDGPGPGERLGSRLLPGEDDFLADPLDADQTANMGETAPPAVAGQADGGDLSFLQWEQEWQTQQQDIDSMLRQYTSSTQRYKKELAADVRTPSTPHPSSTPSSLRVRAAVNKPAPKDYKRATVVPCRPDASVWIPGGGGSATEAEPSPPSPAPSQHTPQPPLNDQIAELQSVLDGWRQLEDQFSTSFEKLRLR